MVNLLASDSKDKTIKLWEVYGESNFVLKASLKSSDEPFSSTGAVLDESSDAESEKINNLLNQKKRKWKKISTLNFDGNDKINF